MSIAVGDWKSRAAMEAGKVGTVTVVEPAGSTTFQLLLGVLLSTETS